MRHRKGWMKIFEASIAITLIMGFMVLVYSQTIEKPPTGENIVKWQTSILDELKNEPALRQEILNNPTTVCDPSVGGPVYGFIWERITKVFPGFGFSCRVCNPGEICGIPTYKPAVYSEERIISSTLTTFSPKKIKIFVWPLEPEETAEPLACTTSWVCPVSDWNNVPCVNNKRTQTCTDTNNCAVPNTRVEIQDCGVAPPTLTIGNLVCSGTSGKLPIVCNWVTPTYEGSYSIEVYIDTTNKIVTLLNKETSYTIPSDKTIVRQFAYPILVKVVGITGSSDNGQTKNCSVVIGNNVLCN